MVEFGDYIRNIPDFPKPGIQFKDITPLLLSPQAFEAAVTKMAEPFKDKKITRVVGVEARGFLFAAPIALILGAGLIPIRKPGKLPYKTQRFTYDLEYGSDTIEIHEDSIKPGDSVLVVDDLLATGGTVKAACGLIGQLGGNIAGISFLIELTFLNGREKIGGYPIQSLIQF
jgi:adenine phosphoribosyltransferase